MAAAASSASGLAFGGLDGEVITGLLLVVEESSSLSQRKGEVVWRTAASILKELGPTGAAGWLSPGGCVEAVAAVDGILPPSSDGGVIISEAGRLSASGDGSARDNCRLVASAAYLSRRCVESARELALGRCLLVLGAQMGGELDEFVLSNALRAFLHMAVVQWANSQPEEEEGGEAPSSSYCSMGSTAGGSVGGSGSTKLSLSPTASPPDARTRRASPPPSDGGSGGGRAAITTVLEGTLLHLSTGAAATEEASKSLGCLPQYRAAAELARRYLGAAFGPVAGGPSFMDSALFQLARPRVSLRLLGPSLAYPPCPAPAGQTAEEETKRVAESAAVCLLVEASRAERDVTVGPGGVKALRRRASDLLRDAFAVLVDRESVCAAFEALRTGLPSPSMVGSTDAGPNDEALLYVIRRLVGPSSRGASDEGLGRLAEMSTMRRLFLPWVVFAAEKGEDAIALMLSHLSDDQAVLQNGSPHMQLQSLVRVLLLASNLMHRLQVLEHHIGPSSSVGLVGDRATIFQTRSDCARIILSSISDVVSTLRRLPRPMDDEQMPEYAMLWSSAFRHAVWGQRWHDAYSACMSNPIKERRMANFRRLVLTMANTGHFGEFLDIMLTVRGMKHHGLDDAMEVEATVRSPMEECHTDQTNDDMLDGSASIGELDLYELAAEVLADAAYDHSRYIGGNAGANYRGCLYALHGSRGNWRRAAQAMDFYGVVALSGAVAATDLDGKADDDTSGQESVAVKNTKNAIVMSDISLSHLGAAHSIMLEPKPANRFIVSGELEPNPTPPLFHSILPSKASRQSSKRGREGSQNPPSILPSEPACLTDAGIDRASRLMTEVALASRALKTLALRTLFMDPLSPDSVLQLLHLSDRDIIPALLHLGYYTHGVAIAGCMQRRKKGRRPMGRDVFSDALSYMICQFLAPSTVHLTRPVPSDISQVVGKCEEEGDEEPTIPTRPTMTQLCHSLDQNNINAPDMMTRNTSAISFSSWRSLNRTEAAARGSIAMELMRSLTVTHAGPDNSLALEVARTLLDIDQGQAELPSWVLDLLLGRRNYKAGPDSRIEECSGLFGNCTEMAPDKHQDLTRSQPSAANPAGLVRLFMRHGLYVPACDVVSSILRGDNLGSLYASVKQNTVLSRLPECGGIDFVPYDTIDMLWNLIEAALASPDRSESKRAKLLAARSKMELALEGHFKIMKVREMGLSSTRILRNN